MKKFYILLTVLLTVSTVRFNAQERPDSPSFSEQYRGMDPSAAIYGARGANGVILVTGTQSEHESQMGMPFCSNDDELFLDRIDYLYSIGTGPEKSNGSMTFTYDTDGRIIKRESVQINTDDIVNMYSSFNKVIPLNAKVYSTFVNSEDEYRKEIYYIDEDGKRTDLSVSIAIYYNDELVYKIEKSLDIYGNMIEYSKTESEFDDQGRPTVTYIYSPHFAEQDSMYIDLYRKSEYEYLPDNMTSKTTVNYMTDENGNHFWENYLWTISGTDSQGYECYEELHYDPSESIWIGQEKYKRLTSQDNTQTTEFTWNWDYDTNEWIPNRKSFEKFNTAGLVTYRERYQYDTTLGTYYLNEKCGFEYLDETTQIADWSIIYGMPQTAEQLSDPEILSAFRYEYVDYTAEEIGISLDDYPGLILPQKYDARYSLDKEENGTLIWKGINSVVNEYALLPLAFDNPEPSFNPTNTKNYIWDASKNDWVLNLEEKYTYDDHGTRIRMETYRNNSLEYRESALYKYITIADGDSSKLIQLTVHEESWSTHDGVFLPNDSTYYEYDDHNSLILAMTCSSWDQTDCTWSVFEKTECTYNNNHQPVSTLISTSDKQSEGKWVEKLKMNTEYYPSGQKKNNYVYTNSNLEGDTPEWTPQSYENIVIDDAGNIILHESYSVWNAESSQWLIGSKKETTFDYDAKTSITIITNKDFMNPDWEPVSKEEAAFNTSGEQIMTATYDWNSVLNCWSGLEKSELEHDSNGNVIHYAEYEWDEQLLKWNGVYMYDSEYDNDGNLTCQIIYSPSDSEENWKPYAKNLTLENDGVTSQELYHWDNDRNDWCGDYKDESYYDGVTYMESFYLWDYEEWCWTGDSKDIYILGSDEMNYTQIKYEWNKDKKEWTNSIKCIQEVQNEDEYIKMSRTESLWNQETSKWVNSTRETELQNFNDKDNITYILYTNEKFDTAGNDWYIYYRTKDVYVYSMLTSVSRTSIEANISVEEGTIYVNAIGSTITISSLAGRNVASGTDQVSVAVTPGIYLITVNNQTVKVFVR